ncbi:phenylalanine--tRNA ligase subunit beta [Patescibacteria group bacterium]|nr:phenylalanine--tRNA ligase subunit beta [Patescibacteria group bacterium]
MKISLDWLSDFLEWEEPFGSAQGRYNPAKIAERITSCTAEVEGMSSKGTQLDGCCVGKIIKVEKHPNADKLSLCGVETDQGKKQVVCGGTNLRKGMKIVFAHVGTTVKSSDGGMLKLNKIKIRGEESEGMICAAEELELEAHYPPLPENGDRPVMDLGDGDEHVGLSLSEYLGSGGTVLDIDNHAITHRADLFSHIGFARECIAMGLAKWRKDRPMFADQSFPKDPLPFENIVDCKNEIPRYCSCLLSIDSVGETPDWMKKRLESVGLRSLNLPIDITNYVMLEVGMPLHSFDADDLKGDIHMRLSKKGEKIVTLDKVERKLPEGAIVLSDDEGIFDLLGVMGGLRSSTKEGTKRIYLHSAGVDPVSIRKTIIATGHRTDAATIYEKGVPNIIVQMGFNRALEFFLELVPGAKIISRMDSWGDNGSPKPIDLPFEKVTQMLGVEIPTQTVEKILSDLEFDVKKKGKIFKVTPPLFRLGDISGPHDLIEEIGRIYGYDAIDSVLPVSQVDPPERDQRIHILRDALKEEGFMEILPLSLVGPSLLQKCNIDTDTAAVIENPLGEELSIMQPSTLPGLLDHAQQNILNVDKTLATFQWGQVFAKREDDELEMGLLLSSWIETGLNDDPFLVLKSKLVRALKQVGYESSIEPMKNAPPYAHPGRVAALVVDKDPVGIIFEVHPGVREQFGLPNRAAAVRISLTRLLALEPKTTVAMSVSQFPSITYDVTLPFDQSKSAGEFVDKVKKTSDLLESVEVANLYAESGQVYKYNLTIRCVYRAKNRTLTEEEAKDAHKAVIALTSGN